MASTLSPMRAVRPHRQGGPRGPHESPRRRGFSAPDAGCLKHLVGFVAGGRKASGMSVPLLGLGLEASKNQWLRGERRGVSLGMDGGLAFRLKSARDMKPPPSHGRLNARLSPLGRAPNAFLSSLFRGLYQGVERRAESAAGSIVGPGICRPRQGGRFAADVSHDAGGIGGRGDAKSGHGGWTTLS